MFIAHRGKVTNLSKENTLEAFIEAINDPKYLGFELDIRTTKDKRFVCIHDFFWKNNLISKIEQKDLPSSIPSLSSVLKLETDKIILIEIKEKDIDTEALNSLLNKYANKNIYVMSFYNSTIKKLLSLEHHYKCGVLNYLFNSELSYQEYDFICLLNNTLTEELINYFTKRKITIFSYGLLKNSPKFYEDIYYIIDNKI